MYYVWRLTDAADFSDARCQVLLEQMDYAEMKPHDTRYPGMPNIGLAVIRNRVALG